MQIKRKDLKKRIDMLKAQLKEMEPEVRETGRRFRGIEEPELWAYERFFVKVGRMCELEGILDSWGVPGL